MSPSGAPPVDRAVETIAPQAVMVLVVGTAVVVVDTSGRCIQRSAHSVAYRLKCLSSRETTDRCTAGTVITVQAAEAVSDVKRSYQGNNHMGGP